MTLSPTELAALGVTLPPTQAELPYDDGEPMESQRHQLQMDLLMDGLRPWLEAREDGFVGGNMFVYVEYGYGDRPGGRCDWAERRSGGIDMTGTKWL